MRPELVFDRESAAERGGAETRVRWVLITICVLVAIVVAVTFKLLSEPTPLEGAQATSVGPVALERAAVDGWQPLTPTAGELRAGFPAPMVWEADRVCIGFARIDFGPDDLRPTLARCVPHRAEDMATNEIRSLLAITSGFDTWHFIAGADDISSIEVRLSTGEAVDDERIHVSGSTVALLLENGRALASIEWSTRSHTYRCVPAPSAWRTSKFCAD